MNNNIYYGYDEYGDKVELVKVASGKVARTKPSFMNPIDYDEEDCERQLDDEA